MLLRMVSGCLPGGVWCIGERVDNEGEGGKGRLVYGVSISNSESSFLISRSLKW